MLAYHTKTEVQCLLVYHTKTEVQCLLANELPGTWSFGCGSVRAAKVNSSRDASLLVVVFNCLLYHPLCCEGLIMLA